MSKINTIKDIKWDDEHPLFKGTYFAEWKFGRKKYTLVKGRMIGGGYSIGGNIDGKYQELDVATEEEMNEIMKQIQRG